MFTTDEIYRTVRCSKNGKYTGIYEIPAEVWKIVTFQDILFSSKTWY